MNNEENDVIQEDILVDSSPLYLPITDDELIAIVKEKEDDYTSFLDKNKIKEKQARNVAYYRGEQIDPAKLHKHQVPYVDNIIWQNLETRISLAAARLPDVVGVPPDESQEAKELAQKVEKAIEAKIKNKNIKRLIKDALRIQHLYFFGAIKVRWDKTKGEKGDFVFDLIQPKNLILDSTATIPHDGYTTDNMQIMGEYIEEPTSLVLSKFPKARQKLIEALGGLNEKGQPKVSKIRYKEIWFTWYDKSGNKYEGTAWLYKNLVLDRIKNPYYDWKGEEDYTQYTDYETAPPKTYNNYFEFARKPYLMLTHQNLGQSPIDEMTPVSASIPLQDIVNKRGRQITEIADRAMPKMAFAGDYISKGKAKEVTQDPNESIWIEGVEDINKAVTTIPATPPNPILYNDLVTTRNQIDSKFATHGTTRGEVQSNESGISKQITREGDLGITDDIVDMMVERIMSEMAGWSLQMMKMFYNEEHYIKSMGRDGQLLALNLSSEDIPEGLEVEVRADSSDEQRKKAEALELAKLKAIDPLTMFQMLDVPDPKESTRLLLTFLGGAEDGYARYEEEAQLRDKQGATGQPQAAGMTPPQAAGGLPPEAGAIGGAMPPQEEAMPPAAPSTAEAAYQDIQRIISGEELQQPSAPPDQEYITAFIEFVNSPAFDELSQDIQMRFSMFINQLKNGVAKNAAGGI